MPESSTQHEVNTIFKLVTGDPTKKKDVRLWFDGIYIIS